MTRIANRFRIWLILGVLAGLPPGSAQAEEIVVGMSAAFTGPSRGQGIEL